MHGEKAVMGDSEYDVVAQKGTWWLRRPCGESGNDVVSKKGM